MELIIDDREKAVFDYIEDLETKYDISVDRIETGDYCVIRDEKVILCIERKTWSDLAASIKDGRTKNINKMLSLREKTGCHLFYLIEGSPFHAPTRKFSGIEFRSLLAHLDHCQLRDQISVVYVKAIADVIPRILILMNNYGTLILPKARVGAGEPAESQVGMLKERRVITDRESLIDMWTCIPGISFKTAEALVNGGVSIGDIYLKGIPVQSVADLKYLTGSTLGTLRAKKIFAGMINRETAILSRIRGISKATAKIILDEVSFADILSGVANAKRISNIRLSSRRLGMKLSERIEKLLSLNHKSKVQLTDLGFTTSENGDIGTFGADEGAYDCDDDEE